MHTCTYTCTLILINCCVSQVEISRGVDQIDTDDAWYMIEKVNMTNMFVVLKRVIALENYTDPECSCSRQSRDGDVIPPICDYDFERGFDRYNFELFEDTLRPLTSNTRCECPCYARDPRYEGCGVTFSELVTLYIGFKFCVVSF